MPASLRPLTTFFSLLWLLSISLPLAAQRRASLPNGTPAFTTTDGVALYVKVAGTGLPCVLVPGGPGAGTYAFEALAGKQLQEKLQMIYVDPRGSGRSASDPQKDYSLDRQVQDLEEVRQQLHLDQWLVMAHSFGGIVATAYAHKYPQHVRALILSNSILNLPATMDTFATYGYSLLPAAARPPLDPAAPLPQRWGMVMSLLQQQHLYNQVQYASDSTAPRLARVMRGVARNQDFASQVFQNPGAYVQDHTLTTPTLTMPVLVLTGQQDYITGPDHYKSFRFPHQQVVVLPGKHYPMLENPREFSQAIRAFIGKLPRKA